MSAEVAARRRLRRRCSSPARSCSSGCRRTPTAARCATAPPGFTYDDDARPLGVPGGRAPVAARVRPRAPARALPRQGAHLQRLPAQGGLHRLRPRPRDRPARSTRGRTPRPAASTAASRCCWSRSALLIVRRRGRPPPPAGRAGAAGRRARRRRARGALAGARPARPPGELPRTEPLARAADDRHRRRRAPDARFRRLAAGQRMACSSVGHAQRWIAVATAARDGASAMLMRGGPPARCGLGSAGRDRRSALWNCRPRSRGAAIGVALRPAASTATRAAAAEPVLVLVFVLERTCMSRAETRALVDRRAASRRCCIVWLGVKLVYG